MKKEISALALFIIAVIAYGLYFFIGGIVGEAFALIGLICLALSIVRFFRERKTKKNPPQNNQQTIKKEKFLNSFFRKDLNLKNRWWHRFLFVAFIVAYVAAIGSIISSMSDDAELPKYTKVGMLSDRMDSEVRLIGDLVRPDEKIAVYEHNLYGTYLGKKSYDGDGGWLLKQEYYCSKNISNKVEEISVMTGVNYYRGNKNLVSLDEFKNYLMQNNANCVQVLDLNSVERFGDVKKALSRGLEADDMAVWQESSIKSVFAVVQTVFFVSLGFLIILVLYYKIFLYILFGGRKSTGV